MHPHEMTEADIPPETFAARLRSMRVLQGFTQAELGRKAGLSKSFLSEMENGAAEPGCQTLVRLADALDTSIDYLVTGRIDVPRRASMTRGRRRMR